MVIKKFKLNEGYPFDESMQLIKDQRAKERIDVGQGWRVYYTQEDAELVLLMIAGAKPDQSKDIDKIKGWLS